jgi:CubicO group peptidase (beta-lactamase class C family)
MKEPKRIFLIIGVSFLLVLCSVVPQLQAESYFPTVSEPGFYVNLWPAFSLRYPFHWQKKMPERGFVFRAEASEGSPSLRISVFPGTEMPLKHATTLFLQALAKVGRNIKVIYDKSAVLEDDTPAQEMEIEWEPYGGPKLNTLFLTVKSEYALIVVALSDTKGSIGEDLRKIPYSLKFRPSKEITSPYHYKIPEVTDDGWPTAHVADVNLDEKKLTELITKVLDGTYPDIHSVLIVKGGELVLDAYFPGRSYGGHLVDFTRYDTHPIMSVTKSFTSALIGIAVDKGLIKGTDEKLISFFPEYKQVLTADNKKEITLEHVLTMTAGFDWDETTHLYNDPLNPFFILLGPEKHQMIGYILSRPLKDRPGSKFTYNSGLSMLLGVILEKKTGLKVGQFADQYLFGPLGITKYAWGYWDADQKVPRTGGGLQIRPRDMAKLGYLFANKGRWHGRQIISSVWIEEATRAHTQLFPMWMTGYGYQWWLYRFKCENVTIDAYAADGWGGQRILVFPTLDLIVVFTGGNYSMPHGQVSAMMYSMVNAFVLPAAILGKYINI